MGSWVNRLEYVGYAKCDDEDHALYGQVVEVGLVTGDTITYIDKDGNFGSMGTRHLKIPTEKELLMQSLK